MQTILLVLAASAVLQLGTRSACAGALCDEFFLRGDLDAAYACNSDELERQDKLEQRRRDDAINDLLRQQREDNQRALEEIDRYLRDDRRR